MLMLFLLAASATVPIDQAVKDAVADAECKSRSATKAIIVCANRNHRSPFRLPDRDGPFDPDGDTKSVMNERVGWAAEGDVGTQSCGPVGPGGWTGCMVKSWKESRDQTQWGTNVPKRRW